MKITRGTSTALLHKIIRHYMVKRLRWRSTATPWALSPLVTHDLSLPENASIADKHSTPNSARRGTVSADIHVWQDNCCFPSPGHSLIITSLVSYTPNLLRSDACPTLGCFIRIFRANLHPPIIFHPTPSSSSILHHVTCR